MVGAARVFDAAAETGDEELFLIGDTVPVGVAIGSEVRGMDEVKGISDEVPTAGTVDFRDEMDELVSLPVTVRISAADDASHVLGLAEGAVLIGRNINVAVRCHTDRGGVVGIRRTGEFVNFKALGHGDRQLHRGEREDQKGDFTHCEGFTGKVRDSLGYRTISGDPARSDRAAFPISSQSGDDLFRFLDENLGHR